MKDSKLDIIDQVFLSEELNKIVNDLKSKKRSAKKVDCDRYDIQIEMWDKLIDILHVFSDVGKRGHTYIFNVDRIGEISDGSHSFNELYMHRTVLFATVCNMNKEISWKSWEHHHEENFPMYEDYFIVGINTPDGQYSYHCHKEWWDIFEIPELEEAPKFDGHMPDDVIRLLSLIKKDE